MTRVARLRAKAKDDFQAREGVKLTFLPFFAKAAVEALKAYPKVNACSTRTSRRSPTTRRRTSASRWTPSKGLLVPVIRDAGDLNLAGISRKIADLAGRTRKNKVDAGRALRRHLHASPTPAPAAR